ncbi:MAG: tRNA pseudouridine(55) synthase TruB [Clostridiales bacterium]|nr:tRNA pseudouridine(55) synthase TruB [Clostridiales bacterium]
MENGLILVYKRKGKTSRNVVENISKKYGVKAGHIGTLDPMAKGLLPVLVGNTCKLSKYLMEHDKTYLVEMKFGYNTETLDIEGEILEEDKLFRENNIVDNEFFDMIIMAMKKELGSKKQIPPIYSAKKLNGKKLYEIARKDKEKAIEMAKEKAKEITIYNMYDISLKELWDNDPKDIVLSFKVECSSGTYIRSLVRDIAENMGTIAIMTDLRRIAVGNYNNIIEDIDENIEEEEIILKKYTEEEVLKDNFKNNINLDKNRKKAFLVGLSTRVNKDKYNDGIYLVNIEGEVIGLR